MTLTDTDKIRLVEEHYRSFWHGDLDDLDRQLAPTFVDHSAPPDNPAGPAPVKEYARAMRDVFHPMTVTVDQRPLATHEEIKRFMSYNTEHPASVKIFFGVTHAFFHDLLGVASHTQGYRAGGFIFAALSLFATFLLGRLLVSKEVGLLAMLLLATIPRYFYDAHLACFDVPITALWALALWGFWRAFIAQSAQLLGPRTVILITHRPASLALADRVIKVTGGKLSGNLAAVPQTLRST